MEENYDPMKDEDWLAGTSNIRKWINGGSVATDLVLKELREQVSRIESGEDL